MGDVEDRLVVRMEATLNKFEKQMARASAIAEKEATKTQNAVNKVGRTMQASSTRAANGLSRVVNISGAGRFVLQNTASQFGDIAVQLEGGTAASRVMAQQLPQLFGGFGALGGALGVVAPLLGVVAAVGIPLAAMLLKNGEASEELEEKTVTLTEAVNAAIAANGQYNISADEMSEKYGDLETAARQFLGALKEIEEFRAGEAVNAEITEIASALGNFAALKDVPIDGFVEKVRQVQAEIIALQQQVANGIEDFSIRAGVESQIVTLREQLVAIRESKAAFDDLIQTYGITEQQALALASAMGTLGAADGSEAQVLATNQLLKLMEQVFGVVADMPEPIREIYERLAIAGDKTAEMTAQIDGAKMSLFDLADATVAGINGLINMTENAGGLWGNLAGAAAAAWDVVAGLLRTQQLNEIESRQNRQDSMEYSGRGQDPRSFEPGGSNSGYENDLNYRPPSSYIPTEPRRGRSGSGGRAAGAGAGPSASASFDLFADLEESLLAAQRQIELLGKTEQEADRLRLTWTALDAAKEHGINLDALTADGSRTVREELEAQAAAVANLNEQVRQGQQARKDFEADIDAIAGSLAQAIVNGESLGAALGAVFKQMAADLIQSGLNTLMMQAFGPLMGGGNGIGGLLFGGAMSAGAKASGQMPFAASNAGLPAKAGGLGGKAGFPAAPKFDHAPAGNKKAAQGTGRQAVHVTVGTSVDGNGNLLPFVAKVVQHNNQQRDLAMKSKVNAVVDDSDYRFR